MLTEQSSAHKEGRKTIAENQYWYHRTVSKIKWKKCNSSYSGYYMLKKQFKTIKQKFSKQNL